MAIDTTDQIVQARVRNSLLKIANQKPGQSPGDDKTGDNRHDKDWPPPAPLKPKFASTQIRPNQIMLPFVPKEAETDDMYSEGVDEIELKGLQAHGKFFDNYGRIKKKPRGMTPSGKPFDMPVDEEQQKKNKEKHDRLYHPDLQISHVNKDGTAHDWQAPGHGGIPVPGGQVNPHGRRGTNTWPDGRQKYSDEELKQIEEYMNSTLISRSRRDKLIPIIMKKYGKNLQGDYEDKEQLLKNLLTIGNLQAMNQGPSTPIKNYGGNMGYKQNYGAGRVTNVRPKGGLSLTDVLKSI